LFIEDVQGGLPHCNQIIRSLPSDFIGCARIFDLRKSSGEGDALVVLIHHCSKDCYLTDIPRNELGKIAKMQRLMRLEESKYFVKRLTGKIKFKINSLVKNLRY
jgi:hypothetical protein